MKFVTYEQLRERGLAPSRQQLRRLIERGQYPQPIRFGGGNGRLHWAEAEIEDWVAQKLAERDGPPPHRSSTVPTGKRKGRKL
jgi:predicted DNA-binding transcriptional regulator AlpA